MKHLFNMKMSEGESITDHLNDFNTVTNQLSSVGVNFDDEVNSILILAWSWLQVIQFLDQAL